MSLQKKISRGGSVVEGVVEPRASKKKREHLKKRLTSLSLFCSPLRGKSPQAGSQVCEDKKKVPTKDFVKEVKPAREEVCSLRQPHSRKMCPKCEIVICRKCDTLHANSSFVAHSLLDHYDRGVPAPCNLKESMPSYCDQEPHFVVRSKLQKSF
ncbi:uncharacterized protein C17orf50 homolog [Lissotriton helveticus]